MESNIKRKGVYCLHQRICLAGEKFTSGNYAGEKFYSARLFF
jgi:hypothetical protein